MDTLYTFLGNTTHYKTKSVHFLGLMNSATKKRCCAHGDDGRDGSSCWAPLLRRHFPLPVLSRPIMIPLVFLLWCPSINPAGYVNVAFSKSVAPSVINFVRLQRDPEALGWWGLGFSVGT